MNPFGFSSKDLFLDSIQQVDPGSMFPIHDDTERMHGRPYLNYGMIAINVIVFIWQASATSFFSNGQHEEFS